MDERVKLAIENVQFYVRNRTLRLPFRYGKACLTAAPLLHCRVTARAENLAAVDGVSADMLPPKWFDKSPDKTFRNNVDDLIHAARLAEQAFRNAMPSLESIFDGWLESDRAVRSQAAAAGLNGLTAAFGVSLLERALLDAGSNVCGLPFHNFVRSNAVGLRPEKVNADLAGASLLDALPVDPVKGVAVRHTVGFADPIRDHELEDAPTSDTIPRSVEGWIQAAGIDHFKIKVSGDSDADGARLDSLAELFDAQCPEYAVTLDGNEQFPDLAALDAWYAAMQSRPALANLLKRVLYLEQPIERDAALGRPVANESLPPLIIDESDDSPEAFDRAYKLGYRGCSVKNCKGVIPALLNHLLVCKLNHDEPDRYFLSSEDLCNQAIVPLHQDLCTLSTLGITHSERNGHHYGGAADHLSESETNVCLRAHDDLYEAHGTHAALRIANGRLGLSSLHRYGYGVDVPIDFESMTPLEDWAFESLGVEDV